MKTKDKSKFMTSDEVAFEVLTGAVDRLQYEIGIPRPAILRALSQITAVIAVNVDGQGGVESAIQLLRETAELTENVHKALDRQSAS